MTFEIFDQNFAPIGASWYYNKQEMVEFDAHGYIKYNVEKDTIIDSKLMRLINAKEFRYNGDENDLNNIYVYVKDSQVFKLVNQELQLVYDFTLAIGDTLKIYYDIQEELCSLISPIVLDSIGEMIIERDTLMVQYFSHYERFFEESEPEKINYTVVEKIGNIGGNSDFLKVKQICSYESSQVNTLLRCYVDDNIHYTATWIEDIDPEKSCDYLINKVSVPTKKDVSEINIYPNPGNNEITINYLGSVRGFQFEIYSITGLKIFSKSIEMEQATFSTTHLPTGMYVYELRKNGEILDRGKWIKE